MRLGSLTVLCAALLAPCLALAAGTQDTLRTVVDSIAVEMHPVYLSDDTESQEPAHRPDLTAAAFIPLWRLPEQLEELTGSLTPESSRLTGAPLFRGLDARRTTVTVNGIPLGHSGLRDGSSVIPVGAIDPMTRLGFDIVRGPAFGGVAPVAIAGSIHIHMMPGSAPDMPMSGRLPEVTVQQRVTSADRGWSGGLSASGDAGRLAYSLSGSGRILGDLRIGSDGSGGSSIQPNTALRESAIRGIVGIDLGRRWQLAGGLIASRRQGQSIVDNLEGQLSKVPESVAVFDPLGFTLAYATTNATGLGFVDEFQSSIWYNAYRESRTFRRADWGRTVFDEDDLTAAGAAAMARLRPIGRHRPVLEGDVRLEAADAVRWEARDDESVWGQRGRFPVGTRSRLVTAGLSDDWRNARGLAASVSLRYSVRTIHSDYGPSLFGSSGYVGRVDRRYNGFSWKADVSRAWTSGWQASASMSSGFRAPGLDETVANTYWLYGRDIPNPDLEAERGTQAEVSIRRDVDRASVGASLYRTRFRNLIRRNWFEPGPDDVIGTRDDLFRFGNEGSAALSGVEVDAAVRPGTVGGFEAEVSARLAVHGWSEDHGAVPHYVPPAVGRVGARFVRQSLWFEPFVRFSSAAPAVEYGVAGTITEDSPGWMTMNIRAGGRVAGNLLIGIALENLRDTRYLEHGSYIQSPGRNLVLTASYRF